MSDHDDPSSPLSRVEALKRAGTPEGQIRATLEAEGFDADSIRILLPPSHGEPARLSSSGAADIAPRSPTDGPLNWRCSVSLLAGILGWVAVPALKDMGCPAVAMILLGPPIGILYGHVGWSQARKRNERGRSTAVVGLVLSYGLAAGIAALLIALSQFKMHT